LAVQLRKKGKEPCVSTQYDGTVSVCVAWHVGDCAWSAAAKLSVAATTHALTRTYAARQIVRTTTGLLSSDADVSKLLAFVDDDDVGAVDNELETVAADDVTSSPMTPRWRK